MSPAKLLRLGAGVKVPVAFATEGVLVTGMRGSGKSNTEVRWAELLYEAGIPWVTVDPKGDWWGVRSSDDGKSAGLPVPVFGGLHGDFPLDPGAGKVVADLLVDNNLSAVLDVSRMTKTGERVRFLVAFFHQLMERHQLDPHTRCVIMEEAHTYLPQQVTRDKAVLKEAAAAILLEGRFVGLGCWAASQRPARLNKDVVEEVGTAVIHKIGVAATNDLRTVSGWIKNHDAGIEHIPALTKLAAGEAVVLAPEFGIVGRFQMDRRTTFDSGATPKAGTQVRKPSTIADIDPDAIVAAMAESIEKAKDNDPKELRARARLAEAEVEQMKRLYAREQARVAELDKVMAEHVCEGSAVPVPTPVITEAQLAQFGALLEATREVRPTLEQMWVGLTEALDLLRGGAAGAARVAARPPALRMDTTKPPPPRSYRNTEAQKPAAEDGVLSPAERQILTVLAQYEQRGTALDGKKIARQCGKKWSGGFRNYLSALRGKAFIVGSNSASMRLTDAGRDALGGWDPLPEGDALLAHWCAELPPAEVDVLQALRSAYPARVGGQEIAEAVGKQWSGGFRNYLSHLRGLMLIDGANASMRLADDLVDEGERA